MRVVYELKRDAVPNVVLNTLYKYTQLQSSFSVNNIALVKGRPQMLNLKGLMTSQKALTTAGKNMVLQIAGNKDASAFLRDYENYFKIKTENKNMIKDNNNN